jgi:hypothetical protein
MNTTAQLTLLFAEPLPSNVKIVKHLPHADECRGFGFFGGAVDIYGNEYSGLYGTFWSHGINLRHHSSDILDKVVKLYKADLIKHWIINNPAETTSGKIQLSKEF